MCVNDRPCHQVRNNILFGLPYDEARYKRVVHACALERDLQIMPHGDMSLIAERGSNLSGGQRQRVSLARAAYADADIYLLDSPLSAVDWHTCNHIMHFCVKDLLKGKTIVMVTHQLSLLAEFDVNVIMRDGRFDYCGPFNTDVLLVRFGQEIPRTWTLNCCFAFLLVCMNEQVSQPASSEGRGCKLVQNAASWNSDIH